MVSEKLIKQPFSVLAVIFVACTFALSNANSVEIPDSQNRPAPSQVTLKKIADYFNNISTLVAEFKQEDQAKDRVEYGTFYLSRPGKLRWDYDPPSAVTIVAKGSTLVYHDGALDQVSYIDISDNIAHFFLRKKIDFSDEDISVVELNETKHHMNITLKDKKNPQQGSLTLRFTLHPTMQLTEMEMVDAIGSTNRIQFLSLIYGKKLAKELFSLHHLTEER